MAIDGAELVAKMQGGMRLHEAMVACGVLDAGYAWDAVEAAGGAHLLPGAVRAPLAPSLPPLAPVLAAHLAGAPLDTAAHVAGISLSRVRREAPGWTPVRAVVLLAPVAVAIVAGDGRRARVLFTERGPEPERARAALVDHAVEHVTLIGRGDLTAVRVEASEIEAMAQERAIPLVTAWLHPARLMVSARGAPDARAESWRYAAVDASGASAAGMMRLAYPRLDWSALA